MIKNFKFITLKQIFYFDAVIGEDFGILFPLWKLIISNSLAKWKSESRRAGQR